MNEKIKKNKEKDRFSDFSSLGLIFPDFITKKNITSTS